MVSVLLPIFLALVAQACSKASKLRRKNAYASDEGKEIELRHVDVAEKLIDRRLSSSSTCFKGLDATTLSKDGHLNGLRWKELRWQDYCAFCGRSELENSEGTGDSTDGSPVETPREPETPGARSVVPAKSPSSSPQLPRFGSVAPKCAACGKSVFPVEEVLALGRSWHIRCFVCQVCGKHLNSGHWKENEGVPYCEACYSRDFGIGFVRIS
eukprot:gnl/TRDRNA2_/TRDRNA2_91169_c0_seq1.p1 gnl/TRDRNA2_/TRDRNA2_91169_c0~~gnl/TRDRNA2_/TRDRNA2_91169_c0_seq1.p1  ORF type:complete len:212 (+),score=15.42 gnl/TRDRNA2_/TRDRNA2_91169_c0_seq1:100-735(+)